MEQTKSFFEIIFNNIIEIPIIQREYAQGRLTDKVKEIREKMSDIKLPNNHRNMKITDLVKEYGAEKARKLVEEEVYLFKHSLIMLELSEGYKMINGHENEMIDYTFKNQNEIMKNSMYEYIGVSDTMLS